LQGIVQLSDEEQKLEMYLKMVITSNKGGLK